MFKLRAGTAELAVSPVAGNRHKKVAETECANPVLRAVVANTIGELAPHSEAWDALAQASPQFLAMTSHAWVSSSLEHLTKPEDTWVVFFAFLDDALVGVLPLVLHTRRFLGVPHLEVAPPGNGHTVSVDFVIQRGREEEVMKFLIDEVSRRYPDCWTLYFRRLPENSPTPQIHPTTAEFVIVCRPDQPGNFVPTHGSFEEYLASLSDSVRSRFRKVRKALDKEKGVVFHYWNTGSDLDERLDMFMELEASGWKGRTGSAIKQKPELTAFYRTLVRRLAERGWLEWDFLEVEGKTVAGQLAIRIGRSIIGFKIAYDEQYKRLSGGNLIVMRTIERAFAHDEVDELNCLSAASWMESWKVKPRQYFNVRLVRRGFLPLICYYLPPAMRNALAPAKRRCKQILERLRQKRSALAAASRN